MNVLIVDDSRTSRMFIQQALEIAGLGGAAFHEAADGHEALDLLAKEDSITILVTDINMPGKGGLELIQDLKRSGRDKELSIFVISSTQSPVRDELLRELGVQAILAKPINMAKMIATFSPLKKGA